MTKIVQLNGGTRETQDAYTGPERELTVDTSNYGLRLHDGVTPGGHVIPNQDSNDESYQAKNPELSGLTGFAPQNRGLLARLGPASYILRELTVNGANLTVANANGYSGNPLLGLASTISSDHSFTGITSFSQPIAATGGLNGNTAGTHTGSVVGNTAGVHTGPVVGDAVGNHSGTFEGSADFTAGTILFANGQIPLAALAAAVLAYIQAAGAPPGGIIAWYGNLSSIPAGWFLCDGANGTPDLRNRFIIGAGQAYDVDAVGGVENHNHAASSAVAGAHAHGITVNGHVLTEAEMPAHKHLNGATHSSDAIYNHGTAAANPTTGRRIDGNSGSGTVEGYTTTVGGGASHSHTSSSDNQGNHSHGISVDANSNLPPYHGLAYIMKGL